MPYVKSPGQGPQAMGFLKTVQSSSVTMNTLTAALQRTDTAIDVEIGPPAPLTEQEKACLLAGLKRRGLNPGLLDIITNIPHRTSLVKARSAAGDLLGLTSILSTPSIFMKHCFGEGNHIGTNNTFFFADTGRRSEVLAAMFREFTQYRKFGYYVGLIDDDIAPDFRAALKSVPHVVCSKVMEAGCIATADPLSEERLFKSHDHLSRQLHRFQNKGGTVHCHEGVVDAPLADMFARCCSDSYSRHEHPGKRIDVGAYAGHVRNFMMSFPGMVHMYARLNGTVVGVQSFIRHDRHLELTEGGFLSTEKTYHAYENIMIASVRYAMDHGLEKVSYGLITNAAKDRLMDRQGRKPLMFVMFFRHELAARLMQLYRHKAHERFPMPYWRDPETFSSLPL
jgi:hypothetical protein